MSALDHPAVYDDFLDLLAESAETHGGQTALDNWALSCTVCHRRTDCDIGSVAPETGNLVPLFNPRPQPWSDHFRLAGAYLVGSTDVGRTTVAFLQLRAVERLMERGVLIRAGQYLPHRPARSAQRQSRDAWPRH